MGNNGSYSYLFLGSWKVVSTPCISRDTGAVVGTNVSIKPVRGILTYQNKELVMTIKTIKDGYEILTDYSMDFQIYSDGGFSFPCSPSGEIEEPKFPEGRENLRKILSGEIPYLSKKMTKWTRKFRLCSCGSNLSTFALYDGNGNFVSSVCQKCEAEEKAKYRSDIFGESYDDESGETYSQIMGYDN